MLEQLRSKLDSYDQESSTVADVFNSLWSRPLENLAEQGAVTSFRHQYLAYVTMYENVVGQIGSELQSNPKIAAWHANVMKETQGLTLQAYLIMVRFQFVFNSFSIRFFLMISAHSACASLHSVP